jgi:hypothetical protein
VPDWAPGVPSPVGGLRHGGWCVRWGESVKPSAEMFHNAGTTSGRHVVLRLGLTGEYQQHRIWGRSLEVYWRHDLLYTLALHRPFNSAYAKRHQMP